MERVRALLEATGVGSLSLSRTALAEYEGADIAPNEGALRHKAPLGKTGSPQSKERGMEAKAGDDAASKVRAPQGGPGEPRVTQPRQKYSAVRYVSAAEEMNARCRTSMEDVHMFEDAFGGSDSSALFGVFDGHGGAAVGPGAGARACRMTVSLSPPARARAGREVVDFVAKRFPTVLKQELRTGKPMPEVWTSAYLATDLESRRAGHESSGCTAATCLVRKEDGRKILHTANVGDTRVVLCSGRKALRLTQVRP